MPKRHKFSWKDKKSKKLKTDELPAQHEKKTFVNSNVHFEKYYKQVLNFYGISNNEFDVFASKMASKLPIVFRCNQNVSGSEIILEKVKQFQKELGFELIIHENLKPLKVVQIQMNREELKRNPEKEVFHSFISKASESGIITRQELVSMLPPLALDIQPNEAVLDMCAAPGSKTSQMIESLHGSSGVVVANDSDYKRANMMIHQVQRLNSPNFIILCSEAQYLPFPQESFDKILVDVPCSGDGAMRKLPEKWENWSTRDGESLHPLQCHLLFKGIQLLKVGGELVYSTCSLNPIEDEAVVASILKKFPDDEIELIDVHNLFSGFKLRKGLSNWNVLQIDSKGVTKEWKSFEEIEETKTLIKGTMFPPTDPKISNLLHKTARILPHDQDSGGFYLAKFRRLKSHKTKEVKEVPQEVKSPEKSEKILKRVSENFIPPDEGLFSSVKSKYSLVNIEADSFVVQKLGEKRMNLISKRAKMFLELAKESFKF